MTNMYPCTALHCPPGQEGGREPVCGVGQGGGQDEHQHAQSAVHHVHWGVQWCYGAMVQWCNGAMVLWCYGAMVRCGTVLSVQYSYLEETVLNSAMRTFRAAPEGHCTVSTALYPLNVSTAMYPLHCIHCTIHCTIH